MHLIRSIEVWHTQTMQGYFVIRGSMVPGMPNCHETTTECRDMQVFDVQVHTEGRVMKNTILLCMLILEAWLLALKGNKSFNVRNLQRLVLEASNYHPSPNTTWDHALIPLQPEGVLRAAHVQLILEKWAEPKSALHAAQCHLYKWAHIGVHSEHGLSMG